MTPTDTPAEELAAFQKAWVHIAPKHYVDAPRPNPKFWAVKLAWDIWQAAAAAHKAAGG